MSQKTDYIIEILQAKKTKINEAKTNKQNQLASENNELLIVQNSIQAINNDIANYDWQLTTLDQAIAKIMELDNP
jgi:hypothetical protein